MIAIKNRSKTAGHFANITKKLVERASTISIELADDDENWLYKTYGTI